MKKLIAILCVFLLVGCGSKTDTKQTDTTTTDTTETTNDSKDETTDTSDTTDTKKDEDKKKDDSSSNNTTKIDEKESFSFSVNGKDSIFRLSDGEVTVEDNSLVLVGGHLEASDESLFPLRNYQYKFSIKKDNKELLEIASHKVAFEDFMITSIDEDLRDDTVDYNLSLSEEEFKKSLYLTITTTDREGSKKEYTIPLKLK